MVLRRLKGFNASSPCRPLKTQTLLSFLVKTHSSGWTLSGFTDTVTELRPALFSQHGLIPAASMWLLTWIFRLADLSVDGGHQLQASGCNGVIITESPLVDLSSLKGESIVGFWRYCWRKDVQWRGHIPYHCILEPDEVCEEKGKEVGTIGQTLSCFYCDAGTAHYVPSANKSSLVKAASSNKIQLPLLGYFERWPQLSLIKCSGLCWWDRVGKISFSGSLINASMFWLDLESGREEVETFHCRQHWQALPLFRLNYRRHGRCLPLSQTTVTQRGVNLPAVLLISTLRVNSRAISTLTPSRVPLWCRASPV